MQILNKNIGFGRKSPEEIVKLSEWAPKNYGVRLRSPKRIKL